MYHVLGKSRQIGENGVLECIFGVGVLNEKVDDVLNEQLYSGYEEVYKSQQQGDEIGMNKSLGMMMDELVKSLDGVL